MPGVNERPLRTCVRACVQGETRKPQSNTTDSLSGGLVFALHRMIAVAFRRLFGSPTVFPGMSRSVYALYDGTKKQMVPRHYQPNIGPSFRRTLARN